MNESRPEVMRALPSDKELITRISLDVVRRERGKTQWLDLALLRRGVAAFLTCLMEVIAPIGFAEDHGSTQEANHKSIPKQRLKTEQQKRPSKYES